MPVALAEKPHYGSSRLPLMYSTGASNVTSGTHAAYAMNAKNYPFTGVLCSSQLFSWQFAMRLILCFLLTITLPAFSASFKSDADFLAAHGAFRAHDSARLERLAKRLKNTPLEVYVRYYQLRLSLETADADAVSKFLSRPEDTPIIDRLRGEWLKLLGKRQQWDLFDDEYPRLLDEDTELTCYALQSRLRDQEQATLRTARTLWLSGKRQPDSCGPPFEAALSAGVIGEQDIWQRLRLTLEAGNVSLAKQLAEKLRGNNAISPAALGSAAADADRYLENMALNNAEKGQRMVALFALLRLAKQSPELSVARWEKIATHFTEEEQHYFYGWLACEAARKLDDRALQWFEAAANTPLNEQQLAWRVRAALRMQDWPIVLASIDAMREQQQREAAWRYWKARALQPLGKPTEARALFAALSNEYNFYGQLASDELADLPMLSKTIKYKPGEQDIASMLALPGIQRTLALYRMEMRSEASMEWGWTLRNFNDTELLTAAEIARRSKMYDRAISAADRTVNVHDFSLRYLAPYRAALQTHIREHDLEEAWVYGLIRQESRFVTAAKSSSGAAGLMQLMPATARWTAKKLGLKDYRNSLIHQLDTNLRLGTYYMKTVLSKFDGNPVLASAAYNAGPGRALRWRGSQPLEGAIYAETIPFDETRDYVKKVMSNTMHYARQFDAPSPSLKQRMGIIPAKIAEN